MSIEAVYLVQTCFTKVSILLFYRRMSGTAVSPVFRWLTRLSIAFVILGTVAFEIALFLSCRPLTSFWNQVNIYWVLAHQEGVDYTCYNEGAENMAATVVSLLQDLIACFMPIVLFWSLQLPKRQKVALASIFFVGFLFVACPLTLIHADMTSTCVCAVFRIIYTYRTFYSTYDVTWQANRAFLWLGVECHLGIICASAPSLKVYFKKYFSPSQISYPLSTFRSATLESRKRSMAAGGTPFDEKALGHMEALEDYDEHEMSNDASENTTRGFRGEEDVENLNGRGRQAISVTHEIEISSERSASLPATPFGKAPTIPTDMLPGIFHPGKSS
jgi:hypothetical protein